jgi:LDH2 family malate/lactate/ureidoglycolate dehydrogenase
LPGARRGEQERAARAHGLDIPDAVFKQLRELAGSSPTQT